jgi:hypothetical protein
VGGARVTSLEQALRLMRQLEGLPGASLVWERGGQLIQWQG